MIEITILQIFVLIFSLFTLSRVILRLKEDKISLFSTGFWSFLWVVFIVIAFFPDFTTQIANTLGIQRGVDLIIYGSTAVLFYLIFRIYIKLEEMEQNMTKVVRDIALKKK